MRRLAVALLAVGCSGSAQPGTVKNVNDSCQLVTRADEVPRCVGKQITLRGVVSRTKQPQILGVDVEADYALSDQLAEATGLLVTYTVEAQKPGGLMMQSKGPGTYYRLTTADGIGAVTARAAK